MKLPVLLKDILCIFASLLMFGFFYQALYWDYKKDYGHAAVMIGAAIFLYLVLRDEQRKDGIQ